MKSLRKATRACSTTAYQAITASKLAVLRTTCANFCGAIRCDDAGRVRVVAVTVLIASSICGGGPLIVSRSSFAAAAGARASLIGLRSRAIHLSPRCGALGRAEGRCGNGDAVLARC